MSIMTDGHATLVEFSADTDVLFEEVETQPPGVEGGDGKRVSSMRNTAWHTKAPNVLKDLLDSGVTVIWDPATYDECIALINVNMSITFTFPDGSTLVVWGWMKSFQPNKHKEGEQPTAEIAIIFSNRNGSGVETAPVYAAAA